MGVCHPMSSATSKKNFNASLQTLFSHFMLCLIYEKKWKTSWRAFDFEHQNTYVDSKHTRTLIRTI